MSFIKILFFYLKSFIYLPHLLLYVLSTQKGKITNDADNTIRPLGVIYTGAKAVLWLLENDRFFRTMFYQRLGILSNLVLWYAPGERTFIPCCPSVGGGHLFGASICNNIKCKVYRKKFYSATMYYNWK